MRLGKNGWRDAMLLALENKRKGASRVWKNGGNFILQPPKRNSAVTFVLVTCETYTELLDNKYALFKATKFALIYYSSNRN